MVPRSATLDSDGAWSATAGQRVTVRWPILSALESDMIVKLDESG